MITCDIDSARIDFIRAHAMFYELVYCLTDEARAAKTLNDFLSIVPRLRDFIASSLSVTAEEAADRTIEMIQDESLCKRFFHERFQMY